MKFQHISDGACPSHFLKFVLFRRPTKHRNHKDFAMPQRRESADDFCEKIRQIKPYKGKQKHFKLDLESVMVEVGRSEGMSFSKNNRDSAIQYDLVKRKMRARGWVILHPCPDNFMGLACTPMWSPLAEREIYRRMERNPDESRRRRVEVD